LFIFVLHLSCFKHRLFTFTTTESMMPNTWVQVSTESLYALCLLFSYILWPLELFILFLFVWCPFP
jgi:hypothetical protein